MCKYKNVRRKNRIATDELGYRTNKITTFKTYSNTIIIIVCNIYVK